MSQVNGRDRFLAFSFAAAHLLLETDNAGTITFAAGARCGLAEQTAESLVGASLLSLLPADEHIFFRRLLDRLIERGKLNQTHVILKTVAGSPVTMVMGGCRLPRYPNRCFFSFSLVSGVLGRTSGRCLSDLKSFIDGLERRLVAADAVERGQRMSMLAFDGLPSQDDMAELHNGLEAYLLSISVDGDAVVRLGDDRYAVLHDDDLNREEIAEDIRRLLDAHGVDELRNTLQIWQLPIEKNGMPTSDIARALSYTLQRFVTEEPGVFGATDIGNAVVNMLHDTVDRVGNVRRMLEMRAFHLVFQPIVSLATGKLHHVEALFRAGDSASPGELIAFAERVGLICDLDLLVCHAALETLQTHAARGLAVPDIAINLSAASLGSPLAMKQFEQILDPHQALARKLLIEVTETATINDFRSLNQVLERLRALGLRICLDDVGSGTTSFMSLNELRVDFVKLDGRLVKGALTNSRDQAILKSIVEIARHINIDLIAEQIETDDQFTFLRRLGVRFGQGYLLGKPSPNLPSLDQPPPYRPRRRVGPQESWE